MPLQATQIFCVIELSGYVLAKFLIQALKAGPAEPPKQATQRQNKRLI